MKLLLTLIAILCFLIILIAAFVWSGIYNVAATVPHWGITHWFLEEVRERSISAHSRGAIVPSLNNPKLVEAGFKNYHEMCRLCHGAPGYSRTEVAQGLYPTPPKLTSEDVVKKRNDAEIYWVIKNGIKMTGMPAFGSTHSKDELWGMVVFVKGLPNLKPEEYAAMVKTAGLQEEKEDDHHHGHK
jgi:mono/diheme cytochrome c family protein